MQPEKMESKSIHQQSFEDLDSIEHDQVHLRHEDLYST